MAHRHSVQTRARGGKVGKRPFYAGAGSNVAHEAESTANVKRGGKVHGGKAKHRLDKRARGGGVGGGADQHPYSSAGKGFR